MEDLTGRQLGPYRIVAPLGEGGMAAVYRAYQPGMDRYVALKILPTQLASDPRFRGRFHQEAKLVANLQHPHVLPVHDFGEADGYTYIAMAFVQTGTVADLLKGKPLPLTQIVRITTQVADALDYAHSQGLVHRDVKPSNVLIDQRGNCMLTDFGIAKIIEGNAQFTETGGIIGTPAYMSPEQGLGRKLDSRADIYALGVMLYEMATGRVPFNAETPMAIVIKHINDPLPPPREINQALPENLEKVILKAMAKNPSDRIRTARAMIEALTPSADSSQLADISLISESTQPKARRKRSRWALALLFMAVVAATVTATLLVISRGDVGTLQDGVKNPLIDLSPPVTSSDRSVLDDQESLIATRSPGLTPRTVSVDSRLGWQDTGILLAPGVEVTVEVLQGSWTSSQGIVPPNSGGGSVYICAEAAVEPSGCKEPLPSSPQGALIGKVSDQIFHVGSSALITIQVAGMLSLRMNDDPAGLHDNAGVLTVRITAADAES